MNEIGLETGAANLIGFWLGRVLASPRFYRRGWAREYAARKPGSFWGPRVRDRIARQVPAIKNWRIVRGDARGFTTWWSQLRAEGGRATFVDDPPYSAGSYVRETMPGRHYRHNPCLHDAGDQVETRAWYRALAADEDALARAGHTVIVWEQEDADWRPDFVPCGVARALEGRNGKKTSREARAVLNGPEGWPS